MVLCYLALSWQFKKSSKWTCIFLLCLVWLRAAYNGFTETVRLLLFRDACQNRQDNTGKSLSLKMYLFVCSRFSKEWFTTECVKINAKLEKTFFGHWVLMNCIQRDCYRIPDCFWLAKSVEFWYGDVYFTSVFKTQKSYTDHFAGQVAHLCTGPLLRKMLRLVLC